MTQRPERAHRARGGGWAAATGIACALLILSGTQRSGAGEARVSGRIVAVDAEARVATVQVGPGPVAVGQRVQVVRSLDGQWIEVAPGRVLECEPGTAQLTFEAPAPGLAPPSVGDYVNIYTSAAATLAGDGATSLRVEAEPLLPSGGRGARDQRPGGRDDAPSGDRVALSVGLGGGFVAAFKEASPDAPPGEAGMWGPGGGAALLVQARLWRYLGVSTGLYYDRASLSKRTTVRESYTAEPGPVSTDYRPEISVSHLRIPLLLEAVVPAGPVRLSVGAGPELSLGLSADTNVEASTPGYILNSAATKELREMEDTLSRQYSASAVHQVFFTIQLGIAFEAGPVSIPVLLRAAWNPDEDPVFVDYWTPGAGGEQPADHTLDLRAYVGVCYDFDLL